MTRRRRARAGPPGEDRDAVRQRLQRERLAHYRSHRNRVGELLVRAVLRASASIEAAQITNALLERMGLVDVEIVLDEFTPSVQTVLRAELVAILAQASYMSRRAKQALLERTVARMAPLRDGGDEPLSSSSNRMQLARQADMQKQLERELKRLQEEK